MAYVIVVFLFGGEPFLQDHAANVIKNLAWQRVGLFADVGMQMLQHSSHGVVTSFRARGAHAVSSPGQLERPVGEIVF
jgi:hypothetical protein